MNESDSAFVALNSMQSALLNAMFIYESSTDTIRTNEVMATTETVRDLLVLEEAGILRQKVCKGACVAFASFEPSKRGIEIFREQLRELVGKNEDK